MQIRLGPGTNNETLLDTDAIVSADFTKVHTGWSDYRLTLQPDNNLSVNYADYTLDELFLEKDDGALLFRGRLEGVDQREGATTTPQASIRGHGPGYKLKQSEVVKTVSNKLIHNAIDEFWTNDTPFTPTVTAPSVENTITGESIQEANTNAEFSDIVSIADTDPLEVRNDNIELLQTLFINEGENLTSTVDTRSDYSGGEAGAVGGDSDTSLSFSFTTEHTIPAEDFAFAVRESDAGNPVGENFEWTFDDETLGTYANIPAVGSVAFVTNLTNGDNLDQLSGDVEPGNHTVTITYTGSGTDDYVIDLIAAYDTGGRFGGYTYNFTDDNDGNGGYLDGPELYPATFETQLSQASSSWNITDGTLTTSWDDTSNNQRIQLRLTDQTWFPNNGSENNTTSVTTDFGSEVGAAIQGRARFSRYGSRTTATPQTGFNGQKLQSWEITFDGNDIPVISGTESFEGNQLDVAQQLHRRARMRFTIEHEKNSLPVESYRPEDNVKTLPTLNERSRTRTSDFEAFANHVTVRGRRVAGDRLSHTVSDSTSINNVGIEHFDVIDPSLDTLEAIKVAARATLKAKLREQKQKGELTVTPVDIAPGYGRPSPFADGENIPIEEVSYQVSQGDLTGRLMFDYRTGKRLGQDIASIRESNRNNALGF